MALYEIIAFSYIKGLLYAFKYLKYTLYYVGVVSIVSLT